MANDDIYGSKSRYERFLQRLDELVLTPEKRSYNKNKALIKDSYTCQNPENLKYYKKISKVFDAQDTSYIRRNRLFVTLKLITHATSKNLKDCDRDDINEIVAFMHSRYKSAKSKSDFIKDIRYIWRVILPEKDEKGRIDETIIPYSVRNLKAKMDFSKDQMRDILTNEELKKVIIYFQSNPSIQAYLMFLYDSLVRPQELSYRKIKDLIIFEDYAELKISNHSKEKPRVTFGFEVLSYITNWFNQHPFKNDVNAFLFLNKNNKQLLSSTVNKSLRKALKELNINKNITCYAFNHAGITNQIITQGPTVTQKKRGWTGLKQLKTYDHNTYVEAIQAERRQREKDNTLVNQVTCGACNANNLKENDYCNNCKRSLNSEKAKKDNEMIGLVNQFFDKPEVQDLFKQMVVELKKNISNKLREEL